MKFINLPLIILLLSLISCSTKQKKIGVQVYEGFDQVLVDTIVKSLENTYNAEIVLLNKMKLPENAFVNIKTPRYRADSILLTLKNTKPKSIDHILGLTNEDISTTKKDKNGLVKEPKYKYNDWGIFGLGYCPGPSSIVSTHRIGNCDNNTFIDRLVKISIHEIGHNYGLRHCKSEKCVMQDAAESIKTIDNVSLTLCLNCKAKIKMR